MFSVKSIYADFMDGHNRFVWSMPKVPLETKVFTLFLNNKILLTKDNLAKRHWNGSIYKMSSLMIPEKQ
jgi:hypothetical protein